MAPHSSGERSFGKTAHPLAVELVRERAPIIRGNPCLRGRDRGDRLNNGQAGAHANASFLIISRFRSTPQR